jgi:Flp pilus assembly protein TadG
MRPNWERSQRRGPAPRPAFACPSGAATVPARRRSKGQALAEFALVLPLMMVLLLAAADFGRVFQSWVELNQAVRVAANFAAQNPDAWGSPGDAAALAEYDRQVRTEVAGINCTMPTTIPAPSFPSGTGTGSPATVTITCTFRVMFPILGDIVGDNTRVTAASTFPIRAGIINGAPVDLVPPTATPIPLQTPTPVPTPTAVPTATPAPTPTPVAMCTVPNVVGKNPSSAANEWSHAGFLAPLIFSPQVPPSYKVGHQNLTSGSSQPCGSAVMTVRP